MIPLYLTLYLFLPPLLEETLLILLTPLLSFLILTPTYSLEKLNHYQLTYYSSATLLLIKTITNWSLTILPKLLIPLLLLTHFKELHISITTFLLLTLLTTFLATTTPYILKTKELSIQLLFSLPQLITILYQKDLEILNALFLFNLFIQYHLIKQKEKKRI